ncbi:MAG: VanW family protein [Candidatus Pacebacteria bacterium]|nr:VanW family protein [Candidatus Paceibacterota bacterium]
MDVRKTFLKNKILWLSLGVIVLTVTLFCFEKYPQGRINYGTKIAGIKVGGKAKTEANKIIQEKINNLSNEVISFELKEKNENSNIKVIRISNLKPKYNTEKDINSAFSFGKNKGFLGNTKDKIWSLFGKNNIELSIEINKESLDNFLNEKFGEFEILPQNAYVYFDEEDEVFKIEKSKIGKTFSRKKIKKKLEEDIKSFKITNICLQKEASKKNEDNCFLLEKAQPEIETEAAIKAKKNVNEIMEDGPYVLLANGDSYRIKNKTFGNWFLFIPKEEPEEYSLSLALDEELVKSYLAELSQAINIEPKNPLLSFQNGKIRIISQPKTGKILDIEKSTKKIQRSVLSRKNRIRLEMEKKEPDITEDKIKELKIEKLIGRGTSNFGGSPKNRINNIRVAASKFNGTLIAPDQTFSFNEILGNVGPSEGYLPELVIKNNKTIPEYGGGICQVSTTMFRAAVYSGMEVVERYAHAFPVAYYNPQGFDATVYQPSPNLRFVNNTPGYILIQSRISGSTLIFEFYGKDDGRKVVVKGPYQYDFKKDGSLKARLIEEVWKGKKLIYKKIFLSSYESPKKYPVQR